MPDQKQAIVDIVNKFEDICVNPPKGFEYIVPHIKEMLHGMAYHITEDWKYVPLDTQHQDLGLCLSAMLRKQELLNRGWKPIKQQHAYRTMNLGRRRTTLQDVKQVLSNIHVDSDNVDGELWADDWVVDAIDMYGSDGFAGMTLAKFINSMKPTVEPTVVRKQYPKAKTLTEDMLDDEDKLKVNIKRRRKTKAPKMKYRMGVR